MRRKTKRLILSVLLGVGIIQSLIGLLISLGHSLSPQTRVYAAAGDLYCVTPSGNPVVGCNQVFTSPQAAIDAATGGEEIRLATGIYTGVQERAGLKQVIYLSQSVTLRGGYNGDFNIWDPDNQPTVLDAEGQGRVLYIPQGISATIEGVHLIGGNATGLGPNVSLLNQADLGGGVYVVSATVTFSDTVIEDNIASDAADRSGSGGGLYASGSNITMIASEVRDNVGSVLHYTGSGGGLALTKSEAVLIGNLIVNNTAVSTTLVNEFLAGGGGLVIDASTVVLTGNQVLSNTAFYSTTIMPSGLEDGVDIAEDILRAEGSPQVATAHGLGGGMYIQTSQASLTDNLIRGNMSIRQAPSGDGYPYGFGGGLHLQGNDHVILYNNQILENVASRVGGIGYGGGVYGALYIYPQKDLEGSYFFTGNTIQDNVASFAGDGIGGGVFLAPETPNDNAVITMTVSFDDNAVFSNTASFSNVLKTINVGGGLVLAEGDASFSNNRFQGNQALHTAGGIYLFEVRAAMTNNVFLGNRLLAHDVSDPQLPFQSDLLTPRGAGLFIGGRSSTALRHTTLAHNHADDGGAMALQGGSTVTLTNTILAHQTVGITSTGGNTMTLNAVLWHDVATPISATLTDTVGVTHQYWGDPAFTPDGYHIGPGSSALARGLPAGVLTDIDDEPRHPIPDLGADEYLGVRPTPRAYLPIVLK